MLSTATSSKVHLLVMLLTCATLGCACKTCNEMQTCLKQHAWHLMQDEYGTQLEETLSLA